MSEWTMNLGVNSCSSVGFRSGTGGLAYSSSSKKLVKAPTRKQPLKISDEEVRSLRAEYEKGGITKKELFERRCVGKITYNYMSMILDYITRRKA